MSSNILEIFSGDYKLLVGIGNSKGTSNTFEILDLESETGICEDLPPFRTDTNFAFGVLGQDKMPNICGGGTIGRTRTETAVSKDCYR